MYRLMEKHIQRRGESFKGRRNFDDMSAGGNLKVKMELTLC
jgi:hypothetical protein